MTGFGEMGPHLSRPSLTVAMEPPTPAAHPAGDHAKYNEIVSLNYISCVLIDGAPHRYINRPAEDRHNWVFEAMSSAAQPRQREIPAGAPGFDKVRVPVLSYGQYGLIDGALYLVTGNSATNKRNWRFHAVDQRAALQVRELPAGTPGFKYAGPSASYLGVRVTDLIFEADEQVVFTLWTDHPEGFERTWPKGLLLHYKRWGHPGDNYWTGRIPFSMLQDFDDGILDEWRPCLPPIE